MRYVITNLKKLVNVFGEIKAFLGTGGNKVINLSWEEAFSPTTKAQRGFVFGVIIDCIQNDYFEREGIKYDKEIIKELMYNECSICQELQAPNGYVLYTMKRMSQMDKKEMSEFITKMLDWCDNFEVKLPAEARFLWVHHLDPYYVEEVRQTKFPETDAGYLAYLRKQHCLICGKYGCDAHHYKHPSLGGLSKKPPDWAGVSVCHECHLNTKGGDISSETIKKYCPYIFKHLDDITFLKLNYDRYLKHRG